MASLSWRSADPHDVVVQMTIEILQLQFIDKVVDFCCAGPARSGADGEETVELPQLQPV